MKVQIAKKSELLQFIVNGRLDFFRSCASNSSLPSAGFQGQEALSHILSALIVLLAMAS